MTFEIEGYENNRRVTYNEKSFSRASNQPSKVKVSPKIKTVLDALLRDKPLWEFELFSFNYVGEADGIRVGRDGENFGTVVWRYGAGSKYEYQLQNPRIHASMERKGYYSTKDATKAIAKAKRSFGAQTVVEMMEDAEVRAVERLSTLQHGKANRAQEMARAVDSMALRFAKEEVWAMFLEHLRTTNAEGYNKVQKREEYIAEFQHVSQLGKLMNDGHALLVLQKESVYTVKQGDNIVRYADADLPDHIKPKLGLLKLVENNHMVTGSGFKADNNLFVVFPEEKQDE